MGGPAKSLLGVLSSFPRWALLCRLRSLRASSEADEGDESVAPPLKGLVDLVGWSVIPSAMQAGKRPRTHEADGRMVLRPGLARGGRLLSHLWETTLLSEDHSGIWGPQISNFHLDLLGRRTS